MKMPTDSVLVFKPCTFRTSYERNICAFQMLKITGTVETILFNATGYKAWLYVLLTFLCVLLSLKNTCIYF